MLTLCLLYYFISFSKIIYIYIYSNLPVLPLASLTTDVLRLVCIFLCIHIQGYVLLLHMDVSGSNILSLFLKCM